MFYGSAGGSCFSTDAISEDGVVLQLRSHETEPHPSRSSEYRLSGHRRCSDLLSCIDLWYALPHLSLITQLLFGYTATERNEYVDGGLLANNPSMVALDEAEEVYGAKSEEERDIKRDFLVSLGTGVPQPPASSTNHWAFWISAVVGLLTNTEITHADVDMRCGREGDRPLHRLNPPVCTFQSRSISNQVTSYRTSIASRWILPQTKMPRQWRIGLENTS